MERKKKTYGLQSYIIMMFTVLGIILIAIIFPILNANVTRMEEDLISSRLVADINYIEDLIGEGDWNIKGDNICRGDVVVGDGTQENANLEPFLLHEEKTGTFAYVFKRVGDEGLTYVKSTPNQAGYQQGHFLRIAGSTKDPNGNSIVGTYMDKKVADILDEEDVYDGEANVAGGMIFCRYETLKDADDNVVGAIVVGRGIEELKAQVNRTTQTVIYAGVLAIILGCILVYMLINRWIRAMRKSTRFLEDIESGNIPKERLQPQGFKEVDILNQGINSLADTLTENEELKIKSETDQLTGLANRFGMNHHGENMLATAKEEKKPLALGVIDIDYFKNYNDHYGHQKGDECIISVSEILKSKEQPGKIMASRFGGDEFIILTCGLDQDEVEKLASSIRTDVIDLAIPHDFSEAESIITVSQGYYIDVPEPGESLSDHLKFADNIMYAVKHGDKNDYRISATRESTLLENSDADSLSRPYVIDWNTYHDYLTRLFNQDGFFKEVARILDEDRDQEYYIVSTNIRDFKLVNQFFGYEKGNEILMDTADIIRDERIRAKAMGRLHGDRFAMLIAEDQFDEETLKDCFAGEDKRIDGSEFLVQYQLGVYLIQDRTMDVSVMCDRSNIAIQHGSQGSQSIISHYDSSMMDSILRENTVITEFESALESDRFRLFLQPIVTKEQKLVGAEALVRWAREDDEVLIQPGDFIGALENASLIYKLDSYVWEKAAGLLKSWKGTPMEDLFISVNVSPYDINYLSIDQAFRELTERYEIRPDQLNPEFTENALISDTERYIDLVSSLQENGFHVEIDDFGTGYSSLNILKSIHADVLKIDKGFFTYTDKETMTEDRSRNRAILSSIIDMSTKLGMSVIVEGVETEEQFRFLSSINCNLFQGFYFSKAVPVEEFEQMYKR